MRETTNPQAITDFESRQNYLRGEGFAFLTNINTKLLDDLAIAPIPEIPEVDFKGDYGIRVMLEKDSEIPIHAGAISLFVGIKNLLTVLESKTLEGFEERYGITEFDRRFKPVDGEDPYEPYDVFMDGFDDLDFTWSFTGALAATCIETKVYDGLITRERADAMTFTDWAQVISSSWFKDLCNSMALTNNGLYVLYGTNFNDYYIGALEALTFRYEDDRSREGETQYEGETFLQTDSNGVVILNPKARRLLRVHMNEPNNRALGRNYERKSTGCPMAQQFGRMPVETALNNPHVQELLKKGAKLSANHDDTAYLILDQTPIAANLDLIADQLTRYEAEYGTPKVRILRYKKDEVDHFQITVEHTKN